MVKCTSIRKFDFRMQSNFKYFYHLSILSLTSHPWRKLISTKHLCIIPALCSKAIGAVHTSKISLPRVRTVSNVGWILHVNALRSWGGVIWQLTTVHHLTCICITWQNDFVILVYKLVYGNNYIYLA